MGKQKLSKVATKDSTSYFKRASESFMRLANEESRKGNDATSNKLIKLAKSSFENQKRQSNKGKVGYDANGYGRDMPLPSSDGILSKIKNFFD